MLILGFNAYHGDVAAAIVRDGVLVAAAEEERFRRIKHVAGFPRLAIAACLRQVGAEPGDIDAFAVPRAPLAHLPQRVLFALTHAPARRLFSQQFRAGRRRQGLPALLAEALVVDESSVRAKLHYVEHHPAHLASAYFASGFDEATAVAIDGFGDFVSTSIGSARGGTIDVRKRVFFPHSLGLVYLALTQFLGFTRYGDEYKVMGLAPYGEPRYAADIRGLISLQPSGAFALNLPYFRHWSEGVDMTWDDGEPRVDDVFSPRMEELLGPVRRPDEPVERRHEDLAASLQLVFEEAVFHVLNAAHRMVPGPRLCLAGGCAMNSVANGKIRLNTPFREVFIQPAAADNGTALGAALAVWHNLDHPFHPWRMTHAYWGEEFSDTAVSKAVDAAGGALAHKACRRLVASDEERCAAAAAHLAAGRVVGWFQGRMEWGARALGNRSILADPRRADMRDILNARIKVRERFRPFAPSILEDRAVEYFHDAVPDPFMMQVFRVREEKRAVIPAVTHVDGTARVQTVSADTNPLYAALLRAFDALTGVPVLLNTSFNENEPIVHRPEEALDCFLRTDMDVLVLGRYVLEKTAVRVAG
jgi:carbamoyltransferase